MFGSNSRALRAIKFVLLFQDKSLTERVFFYERRMTMNLISYSFKLHLAMILKVFSSSYEKLFSFCQFFFLLSSSNFQTANVKLRHSDWTTISSASEIMVSRKLWKRKRLFESNFWWYRKFRVLREKLMKHLKRKLATCNDEFNKNFRLVWLTPLFCDSAQIVKIKRNQINVSCNFSLWHFSWRATRDSFVSELQKLFDENFINIWKSLNTCLLMRKPSRSSKCFRQTSRILKAQGLQFWHVLKEHLTSVEMNAA